MALPRLKPVADQACRPAAAPSDLVGLGAALVSVPAAPAVPVLLGADEVLLEELSESVSLLLLSMSADRSASSAKVALTEDELVQALGALREPSMKLAAMH